MSASASAAGRWCRRQLQGIGVHAHHTRQGGGGSSGQQGIGGCRAEGRASASAGQKAGRLQGGRQSGRQGVGVCRAEGRASAGQKAERRQSAERKAGRLRRARRRRATAMAGRRRATTARLDWQGGGETWMMQGDGLIRAIAMHNRTTALLGRQSDSRRRQDSGWAGRRRWQDDGTVGRRRRRIWQSDAERGWRRKGDTGRPPDNGG